jgi:DNA-binding NarL/FixJ family response regulator
VKLIIADQQQRVRYGLRIFLNQQPNISIVSEAKDAHELLEQVQQECPDLILLDWDLPGMAASILLTKLRSCCPQPQVITLSGRPEVNQIALAIGADAFLCKTDPPRNLLSLIQFLEARNKENK